MERPEVIDPLKEEEQPIVQQTPVEEPKPIETQTDDAFSVRGLAEKRFGEIGTSALDFVPIVGDVLAAGDVVESARKGDVLGTAVNVAALGVGLVPIVGDLAAKGLKQGLKKYEKVSTTNKDVIDTPVKDAAEIGDPAEVIALKGANKTFLSKQKRIDKGEKVFDDLDSLIADAKKLPANAEKSDDVISWEVQSKRNQEGYRKETGIDVVSRTEPLEQAALKYYDKVEKGGDPVEARLEYLEILEKLKPIREWDDIPLLTSPKQQVLGLNSAQRKSGKFIDVPNKDAKELEKILGHPLDVIKLNKGQVIEGRLDISAYKTYNAWITTLSGTGIKGQIYGDALHYVSPEGGKVVFKAREELARNILTRQPLKVDPDTGEVIRYYDKTPFGVIRGAYNPMSPKEIRQKVKKLLKDPEWTQVGFDPRRLTTFYTRSNRDKYDVGSLVESADEVFQIGPLVLAKNIKLIDQAAQPRLNKGGAIKTYKEGGVVPMGQQMEMAFMNEGGVLADDGVERDPVSGNEVPAGSMAEEVRDDVPAMLSEGEYVVPADVVRFHGIDKFEELRDEAKMGLARMEADGRIGGQPVEQQEEFPFPVEELEGFQEGGVVGDTYSSVTGSDFKANQPYGAGGGRFPGVGFELRNFTNPNTGRTVVIPFFNGQPMQYIPPDFLEGGATTTQGSTTVGPSDGQEDEAQAARGSNIDGIVRDAVNQAMGRGQPTTATVGKSFDQYTSQDWNRYIKNADSKTADVTSKLPIIGNLQRMSEKAARSFAMTALRSGTNPATEQPLSTEEKLTLERVLMVAPNTSMTEALINAVTGRGETIQGLPLTEQAGFEFGKAVRQRDTMVKPVTKLPDDLLPDLSKFKEPEPTGPFYKPGETDAPVTEQDLPPAEYFGPSGEFQNIIDPQKTVAKQAKEIIDYAWVIVPGVRGNKKFRVDKRNLHLVGASPNDSARAILATDKHGLLDPVLMKTTGKGSLIQVHSKGPKNAKILSKEQLSRYSGANVNANSVDVQEIIDTNDAKIDRNKKGIVNTIRNALDMSAGASEMPMDSGVLKMSPFVGGGEITPSTIEKTPNLETDLLRFEAGVTDIKNLSKSRSIRRAGGLVEKDGQTLFKPYQVIVNGVGETFKDGTAKYTIGAGHVLPKGSDPNQTRTQTEVENLFYEDLNIARNSVNSNYNTDRLPPDINKTLVQMTFQLGEDGLKGFRKMNEAIAAGNYKEAALQIKNNYQDDEGNYLFSTDPNVTKVSPTKYYNQTTDRVNTYANYIDNSVGELTGAVDTAKVPPALPVGLGGTAVAQPQDVSQFYGQRFDPSRIGTAPIDTDDMLRQAAQNIPAGSDIGPSFQNVIRPQQQPLGFQNIIQPQVTTPEYFGPPGFQNIIQPQVTTSAPMQTTGQFLDQAITPNVSGIRDVTLPDVTKTPQTDLSKTLQSDLPFVQGPPVAPTVGAPAVSPVTAQDMQTQEAFGIAPGVAPSAVSEPGGLGQVAATSGTLPQVGATAPQPVTPFTPLSKPSDISKLMPSPVDVEAQKAAEARKAREEQERRIYEETQKRIPTEVEPPTPKLETLKASSQTRDAAIAQTARRNAESAARDAGASLGDSVQAGIRAEAEANLQRAAERNRKLNQRVDADTAAKQGGYQFRTLTSVLQEEESNDSGGGGNTGGGDTSPGGGDDKIVCTEMYRQTQLVDWQKAMKIWDVYQRRYLTPEHQIGYHWLFKPYVKGMQSNKLLTKLGAALAKKRTQHLKHILTKGRAKDDLVGKLWCSIIHPIVHKAGKIKTFLDSKTKAT